MRLAFIATAALALALPAAALADKPSHAGRKEGRGPVVAQAGHCPPGLAKKSPACVPPGKARPGLVGRVVDRDRIHYVRKPGLYGLAEAPDGQRYAIVDGRLVRIDAGTAKVLSVIRAVDAILD